MCSLVDVDIKLLSAVHKEYSEGTGTTCIASKYNLSLEYVEDIVSKFKQQSKQRGKNG